MATESKRMFQRRRTTAQWDSENPTLAAGEIGVATGGVMPMFRVGTGSTAWTSLLGPTIELPMIFWRHTVNQTIPDSVWTPVVFNTLQNHVGSWTTYTPASTTIAAGSNGQALPQATINVASAASFVSAGFIVITIGGTHRLVQYTGKTATTFTGCTLGVGTMTTGDAVAQANVRFTMPDGSVGTTIGEVAWTSNGTGVRGLRFRVIDGGFNLPLGTDVRGAVASTDPLLRSQTAEQPGGVSPIQLECFQSSTGNLDIVPSALAAPRIVSIVGAAFFP